MAQNLKTEQDCRLVFAEIAQGYSCCPDGKFFIKHFSEAEAAQSEFKRKIFLDEAIKQGLPSEKEKLEMLDKFEHWTKGDEKDYQDYFEELLGMRFSLRKLVIPQQIEHLKQEIANKEKESVIKWATRAQLVGSTRDDYANRKTAEHHILSSFFKEPECRINKFTPEEVDNLTTEELNILMNIYANAHESFSEANVKRIAVCPFFLNGYMASDGNAYFYFGKPIINLSIYQLFLFGRGAYYKMLLEETPNRPPDEYYDDLDKVIQFYDRQYSLLMGKRAVKGA